MAASRKPDPAPSRDGPVPRRAEMLDRLESEHFHLLVVGGGINGAAVARDAALRGLKVALLEKDDFGSGTSSRSSKLVHGGLRYLATFQLGLVRESTSERTVQMRLAPHLVWPLPFLYPVYKHDRHSLLSIDVGLWLYDALALFRVPRVHRAFRQEATLKRQPNLNPRDLVGALYYYDAGTDDGRLTLENALDAASLGAVTLNHVSVDRLLRSAGSDRFNGAAVTDRITGKTLEVKADMIVATAGAWTDRFTAKAASRTERLLRPTQGSHLTFKMERLPVEHAVAMLAPQDQRPLFIVPWGNHTYVGTTDVDYDGDLERVFVTKREVKYLLDAVNSYFPGADLKPEDVQGTWSALRPLVDQPDVGFTSRVSREHEILGGDDGLLILVGGKLTTYRLMAAETLDRALRLLAKTGNLPPDIGSCATGRRPLPGGVGLGDRGGFRHRVSALAERYSTSLELCTHLLSVYGSRAAAVLDPAGSAVSAGSTGSSDDTGEDRLKEFCPGLNHVWAEVDFAVRKEMALTLKDVMIRRTLAGLKAARASAEIAPQVAARMARLLDWDKEEQKRQVESFRIWVDSSLRALG